jgi:hypothetical protein
MAGKSTLARRIADERDLDVVSFDAINLDRALPFGAEGLPETAWGPTLEIAEARTQLDRNGAWHQVTCVRCQWQSNLQRPPPSQPGESAVFILWRGTPHPVDAWTRASSWTWSWS